MCPKSYENPSWLPRCLSCHATPARSAYNQTHTRSPSRPVGPPLRHTPFPFSPAYQVLCRSFPLPLSEALISVENLCHPMYDNASVRLLMYEWHWAHILLDRSWLITCTASLVRVCESSFFVVFLEMACAPKSAKSHGRHTPLSVDSNHEVWGPTRPR